MTRLGLNIFIWPGMTVIMPSGLFSSQVLQLKFAVLVLFLMHHACSIQFVYCVNCLVQLCVCWFVMSQHCIPDNPPWWHGCSTHPWAHSTLRLAKIPSQRPVFQDAKQITVYLHECNYRWVEANFGTSVTIKETSQETLLKELELCIGEMMLSLHIRTVLIMFILFPLLGSKDFLIMPRSFPMGDSQQAIASDYNQKWQSLVAELWLKLHFLHDQLSTFPLQRLTGPCIHSPLRTSRITRTWCLCTWMLCSIQDLQKWISCKGCSRIKWMWEVVVTYCPGFAVRTWPFTPLVLATIILWIWFSCGDIFPCFLPMSTGKKAGDWNMKT